MQPEDAKSNPKSNTLVSTTAMVRQSDDKEKEFSCVHLSFAAKLGGEIKTHAESVVVLIAQTERARQHGLHFVMPLS